MDVVIIEITSVGAIVSPCELSLSVLLSLEVLAFVRGAIGPSLNTVAVLLVFKPLTFVPASVNMGVNSAAVSLIILPLSLVHIAISMNQTTSSVSFIVFPIAFIARAIEPDLDSTTIADILIFNPFTFILGTIFEQENIPFYSLKAIIVVGCTPIEWRKFSQNILSKLMKYYLTYHNTWVIIYLIVNFEVSADKRIDTFFISLIYID